MAQEKGRGQRVPSSLYHGVPETRTPKSMVSKGGHHPEPCQHQKESCAEVPVQTDAELHVGEVWAGLQQAPGPRVHGPSQVLEAFRQQPTRHPLGESRPRRPHRGAS